MDNALAPALIAAIFPTVAALIGILVNNSRLNDLSTRIGETNTRIGLLREELSVVFMTHLRRIEEVIDGRLNHIEKELEHR